MGKRAFIVHGFEGNPHGNWFDALAADIRSAGAAALSVPMPAPDKPDASAWQQALDTFIGTPDSGTFLIGHSLGCITLLRFLSRHRPAELGGLVLAAGFADPLPPLPALDGYILASAPDFPALKRIKMPVHCLISDNDSHVPPALTENMAKRLGSAVTRIRNGGHLMRSDGFTELPQAWAALRPMLEANR